MELKCELTALALQTGHSYELRREVFCAFRPERFTAKAAEPQRLRGEEIPAGLNDRVGDAAAGGDGFDRSVLN